MLFVFSSIQVPAISLSTKSSRVDPPNNSGNGSAQKAIRTAAGRKSSLPASVADPGSPVKSLAESPAPPLSTTADEHSSQSVSHTSSSSSILQDFNKPTRVRRRSVHAELHVVPEKENTKSKVSKARQLSFLSRPWLNLQGVPMESAAEQMLFGVALAIIQQPGIDQVRVLFCS